MKRKLADPPAPLFKEVRELVLRKCRPEKQKQVRAIFEKQPFGELEVLVTQKLVDVVKSIAKQELESEGWLRLVGKLKHRSYEETRVAILEFLDTDLFNVSMENCDSFLDPLIESWDIDLTNFGLEIVLNRRMTPAHVKRFAFVEQPESAAPKKPGLKEFLQNASLSGGATGEEIELLRALKFRARRPNPLFYYRALQVFRDPLHFRGSVLQGPGRAESSVVLEDAGRSDTPLAS